MEDWVVSGSLALCATMALMLLSMPVAFSFLLVSLGGMYLVAGGAGAVQVIANASVSVTHFAFLPIPLFLLMGELFFHSGVASKVFNAIDMLIGGIGRKAKWVTETLAFAITCTAPAPPATRYIPPKLTKRNENATGIDNNIKAMVAQSANEPETTQSSINYTLEIALFMGMLNTV
jgi:hypothetical protein